MSKTKEKEYWITFFDTEESYMKNEDDFLAGIHSDWITESHFPVVGEILMLAGYDAVECKKSYIHNNPEEFEIKKYKVMEISKVIFKYIENDSNSKFTHRVLLQEITPVTRKVLIEKKK